MSLLGFNSRNHPQQVLARGINFEVDDRETDPPYFLTLEAQYGPFTIDVAAAAHNTKCERFYDRSTDGLAQSWAGERVWCNPPYSTITPWMAKAWSEWRSAQPPLSILMLLPSNRTEQRWWQDYVEPERDGRGDGSLTTHFSKGRPRFIKAGHNEVGPNQRPPFGCVVLVWRRPS